MKRTSTNFPNRFSREERWPIIVRYWLDGDAADQVGDPRTTELQETSTQAVDTGDSGWGSDGPTTFSVAATGMVLNGDHQPIVFSN